jgi:hypothetical protein
MLRADQTSPDIGTTVPANMSIFNNLRPSFPVKPHLKQFRGTVVGPPGQKNHAGGGYQERIEFRWKVSARFI